MRRAHLIALLALGSLGCPRACVRSPQAWLQRGDELNSSTTDDADTLRRAAEAFEHACDGGNLDGCYELAVFYAGRVGFKPNQTRAHELLEANCQRGHLKSCSFLGDLYFQVTGLQAFRRAAELHRRACDGGELRGCTGLANGVGQGLGVPYDARLEAELKVKACSGGEYYACCSLGLPNSRVATPVSVAALATALEGECTEGDVGACDGLGLMLLHGLGVTREPAAAAARFERACRSSLGACAHLGFVLESGLNGAPDLARADQLYKDACGELMGHPLGCVLECKSGRGEEKQLRRVCQVMCKRGSPEACAVAP